MRARARVSKALYHLAISSLCRARARAGAMSRRAHHENGKGQTLTHSIRVYDAAAARYIVVGPFPPGPLFDL